VLLSQDGHIARVRALLDDEDFWVKGVGCPKPRIEAIRHTKLVRISKESTSSPTHHRHLLS
jgi:hypothetical protein